MADAHEAECDLLIDLLLADTDEEAEEERRRLRGRKGGKKKKKTASKVGKAEGDSSATAADAARKTELARVRKLVEAQKDKVVNRPEPKPRVLPEVVDLAAAAACRAAAEEARRKNQRAEQLAAMDKWLNTGDPEAGDCWDRWVEEDMEAIRLLQGEESDDSAEYMLDPLAVEAKNYHQFWNELWTDCCGSYEDTTLIPPMLYTDVKPTTHPSYPMRTLQVFKVKIAAIQEELHWPLQVFGIVAARDSIDRNRNVIFHRKRDNCQIIHEESPCLTLTGPTRAIVVVDPVCFEVDLKVKGSTEADDRDLSYLLVHYHDSGSMNSYVFDRVSTSKLSTIDFSFGDIVNSVEATISVKIISSSPWPEGFGGLFYANTTSLDGMKIDLLAFGDGNLAVGADGTIELSRRVVSVELDGELRVSIMATSLKDRSVEKDSKTLKAEKASRRDIELKVLGCEMKVTVAWSVVPSVPQYRS
ncbi:uncharacterized protein LOC100841019 [Brachypodium distachyon]|uniref:DUF6598 domain-containing protein n=1 Tax=Brachypodium distachyon TaxID=15368 RepID=I1HMF0_BRADI|nr:uncharacterized protein LOC100841019 [Brachypodium distachyon]PNT71936.1 hypothetical protein BRADI_2g37580v3 [Brachypodium distachyon]|eukprot:XP_010233371.2 uncharacterized protein LOC100841019 [Brachypodium distachyon]